MTPTQGGGRGTYVALETSSIEGMRDRPPRREAQGDGAAVVLSARESRVHGEGRQVSAASGQGGRRDAERQNCLGANRASGSQALERRIRRKVYVRCAPCGALLYPWRSQEELGGRFLGHPAYLPAKAHGDQSMLGRGGCPKTL